MVKAENKGLDMARIDPDLHLIRARRLRSEGQIDQAIAEIREAIKADPFRARFRSELGKVLMHSEAGRQKAQ